MPTQKWFEENPKVSAYIPKELHQALESWMAEKQIKKISQAITKILEIQLGFSDKEPIVKPGVYATVEQLNELRNDLKSLLRKELNTIQTSKETTAKTQKEKIVQGKLDVGQSSNEESWLTTREAYKLYGGSVSYNSFRKYNTEKLREKFGLEADLNRKGGRGANTKPWIRKI